jgi:hypothetical protein
MRNRLLIAVHVTTMVIFATLPPTARADHPTLLGGLNLLGYCVSEGYAGVTLTKPVVGPNAAKNNWRCVTAEGMTHPFSFEQACKWQYNLNAVQAHPADPDNAFTWVCFTTEHN